MEKKFKIWDRVKIIQNKSCFKSYDKYIWTNAIVIWYQKTGNEEEFGKFAFKIESDKYKHFKSGKQKFPSWAFWESEIIKL